jgi:hypothetical protein
MAEVTKKAGKKGIEDFGYGKGYTYLAEELNQLLALLNDVVELGTNVVLVAHAAMRKFEQPDEMGSYDRWELKLQKKVAPLVKEWADMVLFANYKTFVVVNEDKKAKVQGGKRVIYTTHHACWDAKNRHDLLNEITLDFDEIKHCITTRGPGQPVNPTPEIQPVPAPEVHGTSEELWADLVKETRRDDMPAPRSSKNKPHLVELKRLMGIDNITEDELRQAVSTREYYDISVPVDKYEKEFVESVLIGAWDQVVEMIEEIKQTPF